LGGTPKVRFPHNHGKGKAAEKIGRSGKKGGPIAKTIGGKKQHWLSGEFKRESQGEAWGGKREAESKKKLKQKTKSNGFFNEHVIERNVGQNTKGETRSRSGDGYGEKCYG